MINLERDKELVAAATDGPWAYKIGERYIRNKHRNIIARDHTFGIGMAEYIAHFDPSYITEYHDHIEAQVKRIEELEEYLRTHLEFKGMHGVFFDMDVLAKNAEQLLSNQPTQRSKGDEQ